MLAGKGLSSQVRSDASEAAASTLDGDSSLLGSLQPSTSNAGTGTAEDWRVLMSSERYDFQASLSDEPSAMPWSHAKMQV